MTFTVGQQLFGGFFVVAAVDTDTGVVTASSQALGGNGGPTTVTFTPSTTIAALMDIIAAAKGAVPVMSATPE